MKTKEQLKQEILLLKEDLRQADSYFLTCSNKLHAAETEVDELKSEARDFKKQIKKLKKQQKKK
jgi:cell division septum initiation protein DivIVA